MNEDAYGREIYGARTSKTLDTFMSNDSVPEIYRDGAKGLYELFGAEVSPNTLYFLANNYLDDLAKVGSFTYNWINIFRGDKGFDLKTDTLFLDGFLKTTSNYDARQFSSAEEKIRDIERKYNAAAKTSDPMDLIMYTQKHPYDKDIIDYHNKFLASELKQLRQNANDIRANKFLTQQEREKQLRLNIAYQNVLKKGFIEALKYREDLMPEEPMIPRTKR